MIAKNLLEDGPEIVLAAGIRSPWVRAGGAFRHEDAGNLGAHVARELIARTGIDPGEIDEVIVGCVGPPARPGQYRPGDRATRRSPPTRAGPHRRAQLRQRH